MTVLWGFSGAHLSLENDFAGRLITVLGFGNVISSSSWDLLSSTPITAFTRALLRTT